MRAILILAVLVGLFWWGGTTIKQRLYDPATETGELPETETALELGGNPADVKPIRINQEQGSDLAIRLEAAERRLAEAVKLRDSIREMKPAEAADKTVLVQHQFRNRRVSLETFAGMTGNLTFDPLTQTVLIEASTAKAAVELSAFFASIDVAPRAKQYRVEVIILSLELTSNEVFGVEVVARFGSPEIPQAWPWAAEVGPTGANFESVALEVGLQRLQTEGLAHVISRPNLLLANGEKGTVATGREVPVASAVTSGTGQTQSGVAFRQVELALDVYLQETSTGVRLEIAQVNSEVQGVERIDGNDAPIVGSQRLLTVLQPQPGRWSSCGGVVQESETKGKLTGILSHGRSKKTTRREIGFLIRYVPSDADFVTEPARLDQVAKARPIPKQTRKPFDLRKMGKR